jgi:hypothetical protein
MEEIMWKVALVIVVTVMIMFVAGNVLTDASKRLIKTNSQTMEMLDTIK